MAFFIGEPETYSYQQLQQRFAQLIHGEDDWTTRSIPKTVAKTGAWAQDQIPGLEEPFIKSWMIDRADDHYELDITRARSALGWQPRRRLIDTLPDMVDALLQNPVGWYRRRGHGQLLNQATMLILSVEDNSCATRLAVGSRHWE